jgi:hypothetical protein
MQRHQERSFIFGPGHFDKGKKLYFALIAPNKTCKHLSTMQLLSGNSYKVSSSFSINSASSLKENIRGNLSQVRSVPVSV